MAQVVTIPTTASTRLVISRWDTHAGHALVAIRPEFLTRGAWRLAHSAVSFAPSEAAEVAAAVLAVAAEIDGAPVDPMPSPEDRDLSRMP